MVPVEDPRAALRAYLANRTVPLPSKDDASLQAKLSWTTTFHACFAMPHAGCEMLDPELRGVARSEAVGDRSMGVILWTTTRDDARREVVKVHVREAWRRRGVAHALVEHVAAAHARTVVHFPPCEAWAGLLLALRCGFRLASECDLALLTPPDADHYPHTESVMCLRDRPREPRHEILRLIPKARRNPRFREALARMLRGESSVC